MSNAQFELSTKDTLDQGRAFEAYCLLGGDARRTALLMRTETSIIESLAHDFNWMGSVQGDMGDKNRREELLQLNRMHHFMSATRGRAIVAGLIDKLFEQKDDGCIDTLFIKRDNETQELHFDPKAIEVLAKALSSFSDQTYQALGDTEAAGAGTPKKAGEGMDPLDLYKRLQSAFKTGPDLVLATAKVVRPDAA